MRKILAMLLAVLMLASFFSAFAEGEEPFVITVHLPYYGETEPVGSFPAVGPRECFSRGQYGRLCRNSVCI